MYRCMACDVPAQMYCPCLQLAQDNDDDNPTVIDRNGDDPWWPRGNGGISIASGEDVMVAA